MTALRVGIAGPLLGHHPGWVVSQGERLAEQLAEDGAVVKTVSGQRRRIPRAIDTMRSMRRWRGEVDVVVAMVFSGPAFAMADLTSRSARRLDLPLVLWLHGGNLPAFVEGHPRWVGSVIARSEVIVAPSSYLADTVVPFDRAAQIIPNLLPDLPDGIVPRLVLRPSLLWMRTFHPLYRPELALDVLETVRSGHPGALLTMAGQDRGSLEAVRRTAEERGLSDHVHFPGFLDEEAKARAFAEHDIFVNTSATDNAPVSLLEAAAHGLPLVSTGVGGIPDLFPDEEAALLADDAPGLARAIDRLLDDPDLAARLSQAGRQRAQACTWAEVGPLWHQLLTGATRG